MSRRPGWIEDVERLDLAIYAAIARTPTPALDDAMSRLSHAADYSRLWLASAGLLALAGGRTGRRAAADGLVSVAVTSGVVNAAVKPLARRRRTGSARRRGPGRAACADADLALVSLRAFRERLRVRDRCRSCVAGDRGPPPRARRGGRLLACPHRRPLSRRRVGRCLDRHRAGTAYDAHAGAADHSEAVADASAACRSAASRSGLMSVDLRTELVAVEMPAPTRSAMSGP